MAKTIIENCSCGQTVRVSDFRKIYHPHASGYVEGYRVKCRDCNKSWRIKGYRRDTSIEKWNAFQKTNSNKQEGEINESP